MYEPNPLYLAPNFKRDPDVQAISNYVIDELKRIAQANYAERDYVQYTVLYAAPQRPRAGFLVYADGTTWNPGSGEGLYRYNLAGSWVFIG